MQGTVGQRNRAWRSSVEIPTGSHEDTAMTPKHHDAHDATHPRWGFRPESVIWVERRAEAPNMVPFAHELSRWLKREQHYIQLCPEQHRGHAGCVHQSVHLRCVDALCIDFIGD